jgi:hypothetical protein
MRIAASTFAETQFALLTAHMFSEWISGGAVCGNCGYRCEMYISKIPSFVAFQMIQNNVRLLINTRIITKYKGGILCVLW